MFAPRGATAGTKTPTSLAPPASRRSIARAADRAVPRSGGTLPNLIRDFSAIPIFPPDRTSRAERPAAPREAPPLPHAAPPLPHTAQAKLAIGAVNDPLEREADRAADQVMRMPDPKLAPTAAPPQISRQCAACKQEAASTDRAPGIVDKVLETTGRPLDARTRAFFEPRFGHDFSRVRVHSGPEAEQSARAINARAYATGHDIVFGAGSYAPETDPGRRLLAHELAHVVQQNGSVQRAPAAATGLVIGPVDIKSLDPNCQYEPGEETKSRTPGGILPLDVGFGSDFGIYPSDAIIVADFAVDDATVRPAAAATLRMLIGLLLGTSPIVGHPRPPGEQGLSAGYFEIIGHSDCVGWESVNAPLREKRAEAVARFLPGASWGAAAFDDYLVANTSQATRALNRSVIIRKITTPPPPMPIPTQSPNAKQVFTNK